MLESKAVSKAAGVDFHTAVSKPAQRSVLGDIDLLADLDPRSLSRIEQSCRYRRFSVQEQIIDKDSAPSDVFFIVRGWARVVNYSVAGREITFADLRHGDCFGELSAIDGEPHSAGVMAVEDCVVLLLPRRVFLGLLAEHPTMALKLMQRLVKMVRDANERIMDLSTLGAHSRVQAELLRRAENHGTMGNAAVIQPIPVHSDIASRVSTTRETVARVLNDLAPPRHPRTNPQCLLIRNLKLLHTMVEEVRG